MITHYLGGKERLGPGEWLAVTPHERCQERFDIALWQDGREHICVRCLSRAEASAWVAGYQYREEGR